MPPKSAGLFAGDVTPRAPADDSPTRFHKGYWWMEYGVPAPPAMIYIAHGGTTSGGGPIIEYHSFDGVTLTDLCPSNWMFPGLASYGSGIEGLEVTTSGTLIGIHQTGEIRNYAYSSEFSGSFVSLYERYLDGDEIESVGGIEVGNILALSSNKFIASGKKRGVPLYQAAVVSSKLISYTDPLDPVTFELASQYFCWHNGYIMGINWEGDNIIAWEFDGTDLNNLDEITPIIYPVDYISNSGTCKSDGTYIYFSQASDNLVVNDNGIQVCTFDGVTLAQVTTTNQVPNHPWVDGINDGGGVLDMAVGGGYIFVLDYANDPNNTALPTIAYERILKSYTFDGSTFTLVAELALVSSAGTTINLEPENMWLVVDAHGIWDVTDGLFSTQLYSGSLVAAITGTKPKSGLLMTEPLTAYDATTEHSTMKAQDNVPLWWFDYQDQDHTIPLNAYGSDPLSKKLSSPIPANITEISPVRTGMMQAVSVDGTHLVESGTSALGLAFNNNDDFSSMFTVGCQGPVTQMAAYHCRDAADETWSCWFHGSDFTIQFKSTTGAILSWTQTGWGDGNLHSVGIRMYSSAPGVIYMNFDGAASVNSTFASGTALNNVTKQFMFGDSAVWASQTSDGVFTDLFQYWSSPSAINTAYTTKVQSEVI